MEYARTNAEGGFKSNTPDGWLDTNGPVWWIADDHAIVGRAITHSAITKATNVIVGTLTAGTWSTSTGDTPRWLSDPMLTRPDGRYLASAVPAAQRLPAPYMWGQWIRSALLAGMGWLVFAPDSEGQPTPGQIAVLEFGQVTANGYNPNTRTVTLDGAAIPVDDEGTFRWRGTRWRLVELRNPLTPVDRRGITPGVLEYHAAEMGVLVAQVDYTANVFAGAGVPSGYLKVANPQITKEQADALKASWQAAHGNRRGTAVLNGTTDYQAIAVSPVDAALADMTKLALVSVANAFSVPYSLIGAPTGDSMTYSTLAMDLQALEFALQPWVRGVSATLSALLPAGQAITMTLTPAAATLSQSTPSEVPA